jgi:hypothetical protein
MPSFRKTPPCNLPPPAAPRIACGATSQMEISKKTYLFLVFQTFDPSNFTFTKTSKNQLCLSMKYLHVLLKKFPEYSFPEITRGVWKTQSFSISVILLLFRTYNFLILHSGLAFKRKYLEASYMDNFCQKTFSWKSIFFRESTREVPFFLVLKLKYRDLARVRGAEAPHWNTVRGWNSLGMFDYISGIFDEKKFLSYCFVWAYRIFCVDFSWISPNYVILKAENMVFDF